MMQLHTFYLILHTQKLYNFQELIADIELATDAKDTKVYIEDIPDFTIDESTRELPQFDGSGLVYDSFIRYNIDPEFKALAAEMSANMPKHQEVNCRYYKKYKVA